MYDTPEDLKQRLSMAVQSGPDAGSSDFDLNPEMSLPQARKLRPAGVLVPISLTYGAPRVILTKRSSALKHHPGQIAFPGGKVDEGDVRRKLEADGAPRVLHTRRGQGYILKGLDPS